MNTGLVWTKTAWPSQFTSGLRHSDTTNVCGHKIRLQRSHRDQCSAAFTAVLHEHWYCFGFLWGKNHEKGTDYVKWQKKVRHWCATPLGLPHTGLPCFRKRPRGRGGASHWHIVNSTCLPLQTWVPASHFVAVDKKEKSYCSWRELQKGAISSCTREFSSVASVIVYFTCTDHRFFKSQNKR